MNQDINSSPAPTDETKPPEAAPPSRACRTSCAAARAQTRLGRSGRARVVLVGGDCGCGPVCGVCPTHGATRAAAASARYGDGQASGGEGLVEAIQTLQAQGSQGQGSQAPQTVAKDAFAVRPQIASAVITPR